MFIKQMFTNPGNTGAIVPSSNELAERMVEYADLKPDSVIAELGPGTGVFTRHILRHLLPEQRFFAVEVNPKFVKTLHRQLPKLHIHEGCASKLPEIAMEEGVEQVDRIISGLPWAIFPRELQDHILDNMLAIMPEGGVFVTFAYLQGLVMPSGRKFKKNVKKRFSKVESSAVIWKNVPPAIIYRCRK